MRNWSAAKLFVTLSLMSILVAVRSTMFKVLWFTCLYLSLPYWKLIILYDYFPVPFTLCLPLIVKRDVDLKAGQALVPCGKWSLLLECLFREDLKYGMQQLLASEPYLHMWDDDRVRYLFRVLKTKLRSQTPNNRSPKNTVTATEVDQLSMFFPPCMRNMHMTLRQRHRLSHYSRFYYSLFLKVFFGRVYDFG